MAYLKLAQMTAINAISAEIRSRRMDMVVRRDLDRAYDDVFSDGELAIAAACCSLSSTMGHHSYTQFQDADFRGFIELRWPYQIVRPDLDGQREKLIEAAALLIAEIERIDRLKKD